MTSITAVGYAFIVPVKYFPVLIKRSTLYTEVKAQIGLELNKEGDIIIFNN